MRNTEDSKREQKLVRIRREIEILLHSPLREDEWEDLFEEHYIDELLDEALSTSEVAEKVRRRRQIYGQRGARRSNPPHMLSQQEAKEPSGRLHALSILIAQEAGKDEEVQAFRTEVLGGKLLSLEEVDRWIQEQARKDGPHTWWLAEVPLPQKWRMETTMEILMERERKGHDIKSQFRLTLPVSIQPAMENFHFCFVVYSVPGSEETKEIPTSADGVLERLRYLCEWLAQEYGWIEAQATLFVLTGAVPEITPISSTFQSRHLPAISRIVLTVDPALSPKEVAEHYRQIRQEVISGRHRDLSDKHLQLAIFIANQHEDETWVEKMAEWNRMHPEWKYEEVANFSHDCLQARRRLLRTESE